MFKPLLCLSLTLHFLGDFYFSEGDGKAAHAGTFRSAARHGLLYAAVVFLGLLPFFSAGAMCFAAALALSHFGVDGLMRGYIKQRTDLSEGLFFRAEQILHIALITAVSVVFACFGFAPALLPEFRQILSAVTGDPRSILNGLCLLLAVWKPANAAIRHLLYQYRPLQAEEDSYKNAGAWIGTLERLIMALLLSVHQYSAMGLVLTAKSIARYDKISKDQKFAEYYLLGTLLSTLFVILAYFLFL